MTKTNLILFLLVAWFPLTAQQANDDCENATDITSEIFNAQTWGFCNSATGLVAQSYGSLTADINQPTVDPLVYGSQDCTGYTVETTDHYPDLWYKSTLAEQNVIYLQRVLLSGADTVQIAVYYGQCGELFQSQCFTLTRDHPLSLEGIWIDYHPHKPEDDMYIQVKVPSHYQDFIAMCFSDLLTGGIYYSFNYDRPAETGGLTNISGPTPAIPISVYPNPASSSLYVRTESDMESYSITDLQGKIWKTEHKPDKNSSISVADLPCGMYLVTVFTSQGMGVSKYYKE